MGAGHGKLTIDAARQQVAPAGADAEKIEPRDPVLLEGALLLGGKAFAHVEMQDEFVAFRCERRAGLQPEIVSFSVRGPGKQERHAHK